MLKVIIIILLVASASCCVLCSLSMFVCGARGDHADDWPHDCLTGSRKRLLLFSHAVAISDFIICVHCLLWVCSWIDR